MNNKNQNRVSLEHATPVSNETHYDESFSLYLVGIPRDMNGQKIIEELTKRNIPIPEDYQKNSI